MKAILSLAACVIFVLFTPLVAAQVDFNQDISAEDQATFDTILEPVMRVYTLVKYIASVIAVLALLFAGVNYMFSGSDPHKRDTSKNTAMYVVLGLFVIWAAPLVVQFIIG